MSIKTEEILEKIAASKEILSTMPKNNPKNIEIFIDKLDELEKEYTTYQDEISNELKKRYEKAVKKTENKEIENLQTRIKTITYILELLNEEKTSYEKMELDRSIFTISRYYKENFESVNEQIQICIDKFSKVGIELSLEDFNYSIYVKDYMKTFFQELKKGDIHSEKIKEKFEEIYWKCPEIMIHIELNMRNIYFKNESIIDKYFEKEKSEKLKKANITLKEINKSYIDLNKQLMEKVAIEPRIIQEKFLSGKCNISNLESEKLKTDITKFLQKEIVENSDENEEVEGNIINFLNSLQEYQNYLKFKFIIDDIKQYYEEKENYKKVYVETKKEIESLEKQLNKLNRKANKRGFFGMKKVTSGQTQETKELIQTIKEKYKELDMNKFYNKIYADINKDSTIYDILNLANSYYVYLTTCIINHFKNIKPEEINEKVNELDEFLNNPYNAMIKHTSFMEENDLALIIADKYKLLHFTIDKQDLDEKHLGTLIAKLENIQMAINIRKANLKIHKN